MVPEGCQAVAGRQANVMPCPKAGGSRQAVVFKNNQTWAGHGLFQPIWAAGRQQKTQQQHMLLRLRAGGAPRAAGRFLAWGPVWQALQKSANQEKGTSLHPGQAQVPRAGLLFHLFWGSSPPTCSGQVGGRQQVFLGGVLAEGEGSQSVMGGRWHMVQVGI